MAYESTIMIFYLLSLATQIVRLYNVENLDLLYALFFGGNLSFANAVYSTSSYARFLYRPNKLPY